ncbi:MAG: hypothetical protein K6G30_02510 [Acetatifactor sp.]|nr:hypothetical protein [Acetatifactor sp.]
MKKIDRVHRVGSITLGLTLILAGVIYFLRLFWGVIPVDIILHVWPVVLIVLGLEVLLSGTVFREYTYDKGSFFLIFMVILFVMCLAGMNFLVENFPSCFSFY